MSSLPFRNLVLLSLLSTTSFLISCDKESNTDALRRKYPIPTALPEATCEGANTVGARFDSILFVANYFPNTSSWGSPTPEDGVRAFFETASDGSFQYIQIFAEHPIRPDEIDTRTMILHMRFFHEESSLKSIDFSYVGGGIDLHAYTSSININENSSLFFNPTDSILCGTVSNLKIPESNPKDIGDPEKIDTILMRDFRIDVPVQMGRY